MGWGNSKVTKSDGFFPPDPFNFLLFQESLPAFPAGYFGLASGPGSARNNFTF